MKFPSRTILVSFIGIWALVVLVAGIWLNSVSNDCERYGDLSAECFAPIGLLTFKALVIGIGLSGGILWWIASRKNSDRQG
ncbi:MAG: hypothetical protein ABI422_06740 [Sphingomicrobium sp.]